MLGAHVCFVFVSVEIETSDGPDHNKEIDSVPLATESQSEKDVLIKTGEMTPFGGTVGDVKGGRDSHGAAAEFVPQGSGLEMDTSLDEQGGFQERRTQIAHETSLISSLVDDRESDNDNDGDDEYVPDDSELKYSWYEDEYEASEKRELGKGNKSKANKHSLNVAYKEDDGLKPKKKKKIKRGQRKGGTKPVDDGSEKIYRQRIR